MNIDLIKHFECSDVYRLFILDLITDKKTNKTNTTLDQLAYLCNEKVTSYNGGSTTKSFTNKLRECDFIKVDTKKVKNASGDIVNRNTYTFIRGDMFRNIGREFYDIKASTKLKGYMIKLFSIAHLQSLKILMSQTAIAKELNMAPSTVKKYNLELIELGYLKIIDKGFELVVNGFNKVDEPITEKNLKILRRYENRLREKIDNYNLNNKEKIVSLNKDNVNKLFLNAIEMEFAKYYIDGYTKVKDLNSWIIHLYKNKNFAQVKEENKNNVLVIE